MVFCGKPSKGCQVCRERKIRCDQAPDGCSQCAKLGRGCPGYRDQLELMFRNESEVVVRRAKARAAKIKQDPTRSIATSSLASDRAHAFMPDPGDLLEFVQRKDDHSTAFLPSTFSIAPTIEERATGYFFSNFVIGIQGPTRGHLDQLDSIYNTEEMDDNLLASIKSVGLAGYAHRVKAPFLMKDARQEYMKALRLTNLALRSSKDVKKDTTLLAIMILGIFETVTGSNQRSLSAWAEHVNGAAALVKLRGVEQLRTPTGRRMFLQVASSLLVSCIQRQLALPEYIIQLRNEVARYVNTKDPTWRFQESMIAVVDFRSKTRAGIITDIHVILSKALEIDGTLLEIFSDIPVDWKYETLFTDDDPDVIFNGRYHVYYDYWVAQLWNAMRTIRILLNEKIRDVLLQGLSGRPPLFVGPEYTAQLQISTDVLYELAADILASVPQHLGYVAKHAARALPSGCALPPSGEHMSSRSFWTDFDNIPPAPLRMHHDTTTESITRASGGCFLIWPLYLVGCLNITTDPIRRWVAKNLASMGQSMGIQQALVVASLLEKQEEIKVWQEKQRSMSATDIPQNPEVEWETGPLPRR